MNNPLPSSLQALLAKLYCAIPHVLDLGVEVVEIKASSATLGLPYRDDFLGDPLRRLIHTGVISSLIDSVSGLSVLAALPQPVTIATLDLRVDYLRPAMADQTLYARAECFRLTKHIAFVKAVAYQESVDNPVATSASTFMLQLRRRQNEQ